jgi:maltose alpha-D-glucosyltransferase / alpha-amylase
VARATLIERATERTQDALWYKDAILYELHVRSFHDSNGDGIGDFRGLIEKLDYLQDLGVTALWLLPFYPSPLRDDGYDIASYRDIHPSYGNLRDFRNFLREAHRRGLHVITELVLNHTSDQHPWFQRARRARPGSPRRDFYMWSDTPERFLDARIIFKDFESSNWSFDSEAGQYFWHRFYSHQPDLNYANPEVRRAILQVLDFWLEMGVDGLRLDAIPYLFEREGTNCENLPETFDFLRDLRAHVDARFENRMLLAEANQWPEDAASYFGEGDQCHMAYHFPLMPRMFMAIRQEDRFPVIDILQQTPAAPEVCQWALFLRNHDELTLEMVTDEERDYMYRVYAGDVQARINLGIRRRLAPLLGNDRRVIEMMNGLLFSMPGTPVIYYGDELGMGDNIYLGDRNGVRTPMQWSSDRNAGFSRANPQRLYLPVVADPEYHPEAVNVETQSNNPNSLLWWTRRLISLRKRFKAFGRGTLEFLMPENRKVLTFLREYDGERILVVANLSRFSQYVELDLSRFRGMVPVELFGHTDFPPIGDLPYLLTLGPHQFYWFSVEPRRTQGTPRRQPPTVEVSGPWERVFSPRSRAVLEAALPSYLQTMRWFGSKARRVTTAEIVETIRVGAPAAPGPGGDGDGPPAAEPAGHLALVRVDYVEGDAETYVLPLACAQPDRSREIMRWQPGTVLADVRTREESRALYDGAWDPRLSVALLEAVARRRRLGGVGGKLIGSPAPGFRDLLASSCNGLEPSVMSVEQSNTSIAYGDRLILKLVRRLEPGPNPDLEIGRFLTEAGFPNVPPVAGALEYHALSGEPMTVAIAQGFVPNEGDAWQFTLDSLGHYLEEVLARGPAQEGPFVERPSILDLARTEPPDIAHETIGAYLEAARLLGGRTAELHLALASDPENSAFAPEPFSILYQRALYQSLRAPAVRTFRLLRSMALDDPELSMVLSYEGEILERYRGVLDRKLGATRIRCHGDYHLGQVLWTGKDFMIIDFEGEPALPLGERRIKRSPLRDVAGMIRSFHYAMHTALDRAQDEIGSPAESSLLTLWADFWYLWVSASFLRSYLQTARGASFLPRGREELSTLLDVCLLEKAVYELRYEANHRPEWIHIPARGILELLGAQR